MTIRVTVEWGDLVETKELECDDSAWFNGLIHAFGWAVNLLRRITANSEEGTNVQG